LEQQTTEGRSLHGQNEEDKRLNRPNLLKFVRFTARNRLLPSVAALSGVRRSLSITREDAKYGTIYASAFSITTHIINVLRYRVDLLSSSSIEPQCADQHGRHPKADHCTGQNEEDKRLNRPNLLKFVRLTARNRLLPSVAALSGVRRSLSFTIIKAVTYVKYAENVSLSTVFMGLWKNGTFLACDDMPFFWYY
jgi:hypothetical protein